MKFENKKLKFVNLFDTSLPQEWDYLGKNILSEEVKPTSPGPKPVKKAAPSKVKVSAPAPEFTQPMQDPAQQQQSSPNNETGANGNATAQNVSGAQNKYKRNSGPITSIQSNGEQEELEKTGEIDLGDKWLGAGTNNQQTKLEKYKKQQDVRINQDNINKDLTVSANNYAQALDSKYIDKDIANIQANVQKYVEEFKARYGYLQTDLQGTWSVIQANTQGIQQRIGKFEEIDHQKTYSAKTKSLDNAYAVSNNQKGDYEETIRAKLYIRLNEQVEKRIQLHAKAKANEWEKYYQENKEKIDKIGEAALAGLPEEFKNTHKITSGGEVVQLMKSKFVVEAVSDLVNESGIKDVHQVSGPVLKNSGGELQLFLKGASDGNAGHYGSKLSEISESLEFKDQDGITKIKVKYKAPDDKGNLVDKIETVSKDRIVYQVGMSSSGLEGDNSRFFYLNYFSAEGNEGWSQIKFGSISNRLNKTGKGLVAGAVSLFEENPNDTEQEKKIKEKYKGLSISEKEKKMDLLARGMEQIYEGNGGSLLGINIGGLIKMLFTGELFQFFKLQKEVKALNKLNADENSAVDADKKADDAMAKAREIIHEKTINFNSTTKTTSVEIKPEQAAELMALYQGSKSLKNDYANVQSFLEAAFAKDNPLKFSATNITTIGTAITNSATTNSTVSLGDVNKAEDVAGMINNYQTNKRIEKAVKENETALNNPDYILNPDPARSGNQESNSIANNFVAMIKDGKITQSEVQQFSDLVGIAINKKGFAVPDLDKNPVASPVEIKAAEIDARKDALKKLGFDQPTIDGIIQNPNTSTEVMVKVLAAKYGFEDKDRELLLKTLNGVTGGTTPNAVELTKLSQEDQQGFSKMVKSVLYH